MSLNSYIENLHERYRACMILHAVGDAIGYRDTIWDNNRSSEQIHKELEELGGIEAIICEPENWPVSDDTVFHLAVAEWLVESSHIEMRKALYLALVKKYRKTVYTEDHVKRSFGYIIVQAVSNHLSEISERYKIPFNPKSYGSGAAMRSSCIGLRYPRECDLDKLVEISIESSRMTHHNPIAYLGGFVAALFTAFALQNRPVYSWGANMLCVLPRAMSYIVKDGNFVEENLKLWPQFENAWIDYLKLRKIETGTSEPVFPEVYDVRARDIFYRRYAISIRPGSSGHDSVIIAYDALLGCKEDWTELCHRAALHEGDNDTTGCIAASWFGALYGFKNVPKNNYEFIEYKERLLNCADKLFDLANSSITS